MVFTNSLSSYYEKFLATGEVKCIDEEIPFEIPKGWEWTRIGNIFNHTSGKQQSSSNKNGGTPQKFITTSNLYWGYFVLDNVKIMNFTEEEINNCSATKGDLLVCEGGAGYGRSAIWNYDYDICLQNHVHRLRPCINGICEYVYHFIYLLKESNNLSSVGTAMPGLSTNRLKGLLLPFPPLPEQNKIVTKLGELLPQVEKYSKVQNCLDELNVTINDKLKKSILQEAIQGKLVPQIAEEGTAQELLEQIKLEKQKLVKDGKLKKSALTDSIIFKGDDNKYSAICKIVLFTHIYTYSPTFSLERRSNEQSTYLLFFKFFLVYFHDNKLFYDLQLLTSKSFTSILRTLAISLSVLRSG